jgi:hypothetical protein
LAFGVSAFSKGRADANAGDEFLAVAAVHFARGPVKKEYVQAAGNRPGAPGVRRGM